MFAKLFVCATVISIVTCLDLSLDATHLSAVKVKPLDLTQLEKDTKALIEKNVTAIQAEIAPAKAVYD